MSCSETVNMTKKESKAIFNHLLFSFMMESKELFKKNAHNITNAAIKVVKKVGGINIGCSSWLLLQESVDRVIASNAISRAVCVDIVQVCTQHKPPIITSHNTITLCWLTCWTRQQCDARKFRSNFPVLLISNLVNQLQFSQFCSLKKNEFFLLCSMKNCVTLVPCP